ncbi:MAG TPA: FmdE family protein, partial [Syntrophobacteria bacterium]|nr:FmdE family protein [Syntrophobacteria bacterium]
LFNALCETPACLPDAVQLLTPCTVGNGWLKVINLGRYAVSLYDKDSGDGVRVFLDPRKLASWPEVEAWLFKLKPKAEQDKGLLLAQMAEAGAELCGVQSVKIQERFLKKQSRGRIALCPLCSEPYPERDGAICRGCQGEAPYVAADAEGTAFTAEPTFLKPVAAEHAVGRKVLHDLTLIVPGESKGPAFTRGQLIDVGDLCRLQQMGRQRLYLEEENIPPGDWVHENEAALAFARAMAGEGVSFDEPPREGKVNLRAERDGLLVVDPERLEQFNMLPGVMCASRKGYTVVTVGRNVAGTRAIPLYLPRADFLKAMAILGGGPIFRVLPMRRARVGILVTGTEVFQGLIKDQFAPIIEAKVRKYGCEVVRALIVLDDRSAIRGGVGELLDAGADLLVTTAGLSVDPDDVTRQGLLDAGATDLLYGAPILPGAMTLLARIGAVRVMGVPACALYFKATSFDLLLPRVLAGLEITRRDLAKLGHGSFCLECKRCTFPKCPFGS